MLPSGAVKTTIEHRELGAMNLRGLVAVSLGVAVELDGVTRKMIPLISASSSAMAPR
jgi:hypothetical protein